MKTLTISKLTISKLNTTKDSNGRTTSWGTRMGRTTSWGTRG